MIDRSQFNAEDFLVDSTFQQYCIGTDKICVGYWEKYIAAHPEQANVIAEAKRLHFILSGNKRSLNTSVDLLKQSFNPEIEKYRFTATFSQESIEQVMSALQKVENFKYEIKGNQVIISK